MAGRAGTRRNAHRKPHNDHWSSRSRVASSAARRTACFRSRDDEKTRSYWRGHEEAEIKIPFARTVAGTIALVLLMISQSAAEGSLDEAKALYAAASFENALAVLGRLDA